VPSPGSSWWRGGEVGRGADQGIARTSRGIRRDLRSPRRAAPALLRPSRRSRRGRRSGRRGFSHRLRAPLRVRRWPLECVPLALRQRLESAPHAAKNRGAGSSGGANAPRGSAKPPRGRGSRQRALGATEIGGRDRRVAGGRSSRTSPVRAGGARLRGNRDRARDPGRTVRSRISRRAPSIAASRRQAWRSRRAITSGTGSWTTIRRGRALKPSRSNAARASWQVARSRAASSSARSKA